MTGNGECEALGFTELVKCYRQGEYLKASGWSTSTGRSGAWSISPPLGWEFDPDKPDQQASSLGVHGGCPDCIMTLVHYRKIAPIETRVETKVETTLLEAPMITVDLEQTGFPATGKGFDVEKLKDPKVILVVGVVAIALIGVIVAKQKGMI